MGCSRAAQGDVRSVAAQVHQPYVAAEPSVTSQVADLAQLVVDATAQPVASGICD
jgi:hypothetical protein